VSLLWFILLVNCKDYPFGYKRWNIFASSYFLRAAVYEKNHWKIYVDKNWEILVLLDSSFVLCHAVKGHDLLNFLSEGKYF
jgi:hypothetical protein